MTSKCGVCGLPTKPCSKNGVTENTLKESNDEVHPRNVRKRIVLKSNEASAGLLNTAVSLPESEKDVFSNAIVLEQFS